MSKKLVYLLLLAAILILVLFVAVRKSDDLAMTTEPTATTTVEEATSTAVVDHTPTTIDLSDAEWIESPVTPQGTQFSYPATLPTEYISVTSEWPPLVELTAGEYVCEEGEILAADGPIKLQQRRVVGTHEYCLTTFTEAAAGSAYTNYDYSTEQGDFVVRVVFTLRSPQCANYDEDEEEACEYEKTHFDTDILADRIAASLRVL